MNQTWILIGSLAGFIGVGAGAFGAHALSERLSPRELEIWQTATQYQMFHALALVAVGLWGAHTGPTPASNASGWAFAVGILVFSGSLYALALSGVKILGAITPIGGLSFLIGWICLAIAAWKAASA